MARIGWRAWFTGSRVFTSRRTDPEDLPEDGCLVVVEYLDQDTPKRITHSGTDHYFWWQGPDGLVIGSTSDPVEEIEERYPGAVIVRGKWTTPAEMRDTRREAEEKRWR